MASAGLPLAGIVVLDFAHMMQGPWAAEMLGDLGADVIKIEALSGERGRQSGTVFVGGFSAQYLAMNKNKRSVALNLKSPEGLAAAKKLVARADVLIQNFRPGTMERLGLGPEQAMELNPRLIYCAATGYGSDVPDPKRAGQDLLAQARTGAMWLSGTTDDPPVPCGPFVADIHAATMLALGVSAALVSRATTGAGAFLEIDLVGAMLHQQVQEVSSRVNGGAEVRRHSRAGSPFIEAPYGAYRCSDDKWLVISLTTSEDLAAGLDEPSIQTDFPTKTDAIEKRDELYAVVERTVATRTRAEWLERLEAQGVWCAPVNDYDEMRDDPYVDWDDRSVTLQKEGVGDITLVNNPIRVNGSRLPVRYAPPALGEQTEEVLAELGLTTEEIKELRSNGAIG